MIGKRDILEISCKILGLISLTWSLRYLSSAPFIYSVERQKMIYLIIAPFVLYLISAFILFRFSRGIASLLVRTDGPVELGTLGNQQKPIYTLCLRVAGAVVVTKAVPSVVKEVLGIALHSRRVFATWIPLVSAIVYLALGIYFIGGAKAIVKVAMKGSLRESDADDT
jgi:hypothetical protein